MPPPPRTTGRARRRRVSRRTYWVRRAVALAVVVVVGFSVFKAVGGLFGSDGDRIAGATTDSTTPGSADSTPATPGSSAGDDVAGTVDTTPATDPGETFAPSAEHPAKVYIVGDSDAGAFGPYLKDLIDATLITDTELNYKVSSGLARPDFFDWPAELRRTIPEVDPDIVVITFGGNDSQGLSKFQENLEWEVGDPVDNTAEWSAEYERRVLEVVDIVSEGGAKIVWVGIPNDDNPDVTARLKIQDSAVRAALAQRPDVVFVDTWSRFSGRDGNWAEFVVDPRDGEGKDVRADDGFHLNTTGAEILAIDIAVAVRDQLRALGATI